MWEWVFWSGLITYFLLIVGSLFQFDFAVILVILFSGLGVMAYARFRRFPPLFEAYEHQLARQRYLARARSSRPEATIRSKGVRRRGKKRRRGRRLVGAALARWRSAASGSATGGRRARPERRASRARSSMATPAA